MVLGWRLAGPSAAGVAHRVAGAHSLAVSYSVLAIIVALVLVGSTPATRKPLLALTADGAVGHWRRGASRQIAGSTPMCRCRPRASGSAPRRERRRAGARPRHRGSGGDRQTAERVRSRGSSDPAAATIDEPRADKAPSRHRRYRRRRVRRAEVAHPRRRRRTRARGLPGPRAPRPPASSGCRAAAAPPAADRASPGSPSRSIAASRPRRARRPPRGSAPVSASPVSAGLPSRPPRAPPGGLGRRLRDRERHVGRRGLCLRSRSARPGRSAGLAHRRQRGAKAVASAWRPARAPVRAAHRPGLRDRRALGEAGGHRGQRRRRARRSAPPPRRRPGAGERAAKSASTSCTDSAAFMATPHICGPPDWLDRTCSLVADATSVRPQSCISRRKGGV